MAEKNNGSGNGNGANVEEKEITPVGPGAEQEEIHAESDEEQRASGEDEGDEDDERVGRSEEEEDGQDEPQSGRKTKRQKERKWRRERQKTERVELRFLRQRNEELERRQSAIDARLDGVDINQVDTRIGMIDEQIAEAERLHAEAITKQNGQAATEALQIRDNLRDQKSQLSGFRNQKVGQARQRQQEGTNPAMDPRIKRHAENWVNENEDWFDPQLRDEDSRLARAIEDNLFREKGGEAGSPEYWKEYNRRLAKRGIGPFAEEDRSRQERDRDDEDEEEEPEERPQKRRQPKGPRITTGGRERPLKKGEVFVSAERRQAMEEAGVWDKPELRNKYLRQYARYDAEHRNDRSRR